MSDGVTGTGQPRKRLLEQMRDKLRAMHYSYRTEQAYLDWIKRFILFHGKRHPCEIGAREIEAFVSYLATDRGVSASTQTQALSAVLYLYKHVLETEIGWIEGISRAKKPQRVPIVLTRDEVAAVLARLSGRERLMAALMYGTGLRLMECVQLRVQNLDFGYRQMTVINGKGAKDRFVPLPEALIPELKQCIAESERLLAADKADGFGEVSMPESLLRKTPSAPFDLRWWYVFPASHRIARAIPSPVGSKGTIWTRRSCRRRCGGPCWRPASASGRRRVRCGMPLQHICSRRATISAPSRHCWVTETSRRRKFTLTFCSAGAGRCGARSMPCSAGALSGRGHCWGLVPDAWQSHRWRACPRSPPGPPLLEIGGDDFSMPRRL